MLSSVSLSNTEQTVYTVPSGKKALVYVDIYASSSNTPMTLKINNLNYYSGNITGVFSVKLALTSGDTVKVSTTGTVNVFVHGIEV